MAIDTVKSVTELESSLSSKQDDLRNHLGLAAAVGSTGDSELRALHRQVARLHLALHSAKTRKKNWTDPPAPTAQRPAPPQKGATRGKKFGRAPGGFEPVPGL